MAESNDTTTCTRTIEKNTNLLFEPAALIPSLSAKYVPEANFPFGDLLNDSSALLGSGIELLRGIAYEYDGRGGMVRDSEKVYGVLYLLEAAQTTLHDGHSVAMKADPIGGDPESFGREMDLLIDFIKEGRSSSALNMLECIKRNVCQNVGGRDES